MDPAREAIVNEEMVKARAPGAIGGGVSMLGPTLITWGTEEQKKRYLPKVLTAEETGAKATLNRVQGPI